VGQWPGHTTNKPTAQDPLPNPDINPAPPGNANGSTTAATLNGPRALTFDASGNLYIAAPVTTRCASSKALLSAPSPAWAARMTPATTGQATSATLNGPRGVMLDPIFGNLYISDYGQPSHSAGQRPDRDHHHRCRHRGGRRQQRRRGPRQPSDRSTGPTWVRFDSMGDMFISDLNNSRVREVYGGADPMGVFNTSSGSDVSVSPSIPPAAYSRRSSPSPR